MRRALVSRLCHVASGPAFAKQTNDNLRQNPTTEGKAVGAACRGLVARGARAAGHGDASVLGRMSGGGVLCRGWREDGGESKRNRQM
eukprot:353880-Chlamydomonas_euryale.AAC.5